MADETRSAPDLAEFFVRGIQDAAAVGAFLRSVPGERWSAFQVNAEVGLNTQRNTEFLVAETLGSGEYNNPQPVTMDLFARKELHDLKTRLLREEARRRETR